jgi:hypothetical protein
MVRRLDHGGSRRDCDCACATEWVVDFGITGRAIQIKMAAAIPVTAVPMIVQGIIRRRCGANSSSARLPA